MKENVFSVFNAMTDSFSTFWYNKRIDDFVEKSLKLCFSCYLWMNWITFYAKISTNWLKFKENNEEIN